MGLFDNERQNEAKRLYGADLGKYDDLLKAVLGSQSEFEGINTTGDIGSKFGISSDVSGIYDPQRRNLATSFAKRSKDIASASGRSGMTEFSSLPAQQDYFQQLNNLGSSEAQSTIGRQDKIAQMLQEILGNRQGFGERKRGAQMSALGAKQGATQGYLGALSGSSTFDDILAGLGTAADIGKSAVGLF